ncbi:hypothetical protein ZOSMA_47G00530 [Zostera marina]|uniref:Uncharacterized protein n=1 Tax=Zostera marina TaxID=29655 RepID=A0A0K9P204_ZOSMR|nr:hypothetical protein ZOSMA_47G00530 [Zostera marina]
MLPLSFFLSSSVSTFHFHRLNAPSSSAPMAGFSSFKRLKITVALMDNLFSLEPDQNNPQSNVSDNGIKESRNECRWIRSASCALGTTLSHILPLVMSPSTSTFLCPPF